MKLNIRPIRFAAQLCVVLVCWGVPLTAHAEDWPQWRGPHQNGSSQETGLPDALSPQTLAWSVDLPGPSAATPIVSGDRVFLTAQDPASKKLIALAVSRKEGKIVWSHDVGVSNGANKMADQASPSPVADGSRVYFFFGTGDLACFDYDGKPLWSRNIQADHGPFNILWLYASSPLLFDGKLYIEVLQRDTPINGAPPPTPAESYLLAIDPATGRELWKQVRPSNAVKEAREAYTTPVPMDTPHGPEIVVMGGDCVTGHDPATGHELWRSDDYNPEKINHWRTVTSACIAGDVVVACPPKTGTLFAVRPGGDSQAPTAWKSDLRSDVCVPLYYNNKVYVLSGDKPGKTALDILDPKTGEKLRTGQLDSKKVFRASPTGADGKIYLMNEAGDVWVVNADTLAVLYTGSLVANKNAPRSRSTIAVADGQVFVRTAEKLLVFGKGK
jgi:outer membrane protein assembly factor BamB